MEESSTIFSIVFIGIFLVILLGALVIIIGALNSGNRQVGNIWLGSTSEILSENFNSSSSLLVGNLSNPNCQVNSISNNGYLLDSSFYTENNCQITIIK